VQQLLQTGGAAVEALQVRFPVRHGLVVIAPSFLQDACTTASLLDYYMSCVTPSSKRSSLSSAWDSRRLHYSIAT
jgi:hypothetical protein